MSIASEIERIDGLKDRLGTKLQGMGLVSPAPNLEASVEAVEGIADNGAANGSISAKDESYTIAKGYHNGSGTVQIAQQEKEKLLPENIKSGVSLLGVVGNFNGGGAKLQTKTATPTKAQQIISPDEGYDGLSAVTVEAIPANYADITPTTAEPENVLATKIYIDSTGAKKTGTMPDNGAVQGSIDGMVSDTYTIPQGYHNGSGKVQLSGTVEAALAAI